MAEPSETRIRTNYEYGLSKCEDFLMDVHNCNNIKLCLISM